MTRRTVVRCIASALCVLGPLWGLQPGGFAQSAAKPATTAAPAAAKRPLFEEYKGVRLGMPASEVRAKLGAAESSDDAQDNYVFSESEQARVYYDDRGLAKAIVATFIGRIDAAPKAEDLFGEPVTADANGNASKSMTYEDIGAMLVYSRTGGDTPMVFVTLQKIR